LADISISLKKEEKFYLDKLDEVRGLAGVSPFCKKIILDYLDRIMDQSVGGKPLEAKTQLKEYLKKLDDSLILNQEINNMDNIDDLVHLENTLYSLSIKVSKKIKWGTINAR